MINKIFLKNRELRNFLNWLFIFLLSEYLLLFFIETILPGFVSGVFNLNILLFFILLLWLFLVFTEKKGEIDEKEKSGFFPANNFLKAVFFLDVVVIFSCLIFVFYKLNIWEIIFFLLMVLFSGKFLFDYFK